MVCKYKINNYICDMEISKSIFALAKSNNGLFKSEKQSDFLISQLKKFEGCIGHGDSGYNSCPIFASWDDKGVTKIIKSSKNGDVLMFERKQEGILTFLEIKKIKSLQRKLKKLKKEIEEKQISFEDGSYNGTGDVSTYSKDMINRFNYFQEQKKSQCLEIQKIINQIK
jgi:hypothetical protein